MRIKPIENDQELQITLAAYEKFDRAVGDLLSQDVPASQQEQLRRDAQADSLISVRDELLEAIQKYRDRISS